MTTAAKKKPAAAGEGVRVRVLVDCTINGERFAPNDIAEVADPAAHAGLVDANPDAVAYAESLQA